MPISSQSVLRFYLGNESREIDFSKTKFPPWYTVLRYLREIEGLMGTKEGCAEGDCGACTVVVGEYSKNGMRYKAVNACLMFLPMLHGKQLITVEHLGDDKKLHTVQKALVNANASQCGFCTPGIVMSMFAAHKSGLFSDEHETSLALAGNLCRCTGYDSIREATEFLSKEESNDKRTEIESEIVARLIDLNMNHPYFVVSLPEYSYLRTPNLEKSLAAIADNKDAQVISGATDIGLLVTKKWQSIPKIIDIGAIPELREIEIGEETVRIGASADLELVRSEIQDVLPAMAAILEVFGSKQIRNLAGIGGNVSSASPVSDLLPLLFAYNASVKLLSVRGSRVVFIQDFVKAYRETVLDIDEILTEVLIPIPSTLTSVAADKLSKRVDVDISSVSAAIRIRRDDERLIRDICIVYGGMAAMAKRASHCESVFLDKELNKAIIDEAVQALRLDFEPISDARATAEGRELMAANLLRKLIGQIS